MRWEWKRFRRSFVYCAARVVFTARQVHVRFDNLALTQKDVLVYICSSRTDWPSLRALLDS